MQLLLLNYREELIAAKIAQERASEFLTNELELVHSQAAEECQKEQTENQRLKNYVVELQEQLGKYCSSNKFANW